MGRERLLAFLKRVQFEKSRVVEWSHGETRCPVCDMIGVNSIGYVIAIKTMGEIRYCECRRCGSHFRAVGKVRAEKVQKNYATTNNPIRIEGEDKGEKREHSQSTRRTKRSKRRH